MNEDASNRKNKSDDDQTKMIQNQAAVTQIPGISGASLSYLPGDTIDGTYLLTRLLGRGGMGAVFACHHRALDKNYALKLLSAEQINKESWSRFEVEARALARLNHPGIVGIHNMGIDKGQCPYYVMDLLSGFGLDALIARDGHLDYDKALNIFVQVAEALGSAHAQGIIHRDIKPSNLMVENEQSPQAMTVKLVDFGIARVNKQDLPSQSQTATGLIFGTPYYMSPEQCQGQKVDERSDIYSFGCAFFEALTGKPPFIGENAFHTFMMHQNYQPPDLPPQFPPALNLAIKKMLQKDPESRYQSMNMLSHDLIRLRDGKAILDAGARTADFTQRNNKPAPTKKFPAKVTYAVISLAAILILLMAATAINVYHPSDKLLEKPAMVSQKPDIQKKTAMSLENSDEDNFNKTISDNFWNEKTASKTSNGLPVDKLKSYGATEEEIAAISPLQMAALYRAIGIFQLRYQSHEHEAGWSKPFLTDGQFKFPTDIYIGSIKIDNQKPNFATGKIAVKPDQEVCFFTVMPLRNQPGFLDKFAVNDLTGLAAIFDSVDSILSRVKKWHRLKDLYFFNPLLKAMPDQDESLDETKMSDQDLPKIDKLSGLRALGLCYPVTGPGILKMLAPHRVQSLWLKRIDNLAPLLAALPDYDNLEELALIHQDLRDSQLQSLTKMPNLKTLKILRSYLTPASSKYFQKMPRLRSLILDHRDWSAGQREAFKKALPDCNVSFERVTETYYWYLLKSYSALED